ncbi:MAG: DUF983 domain-containing protein, partial [Alphaproteobacteria bacterium]
IMAPLLLFVWSTFRPEPWKMAVGFCIFFTALALAMLPRLKGMLVGIQWAKRMHGFGLEGQPAAAAHLDGDETRL